MSVEYYKLSSTVYLPKSGENYMNILTIDSLPKKSSSLYPYIRVLSYSKLSPFDTYSYNNGNNNCGQERPQCIFAFINPSYDEEDGYETYGTNNNQLLCVNQISSLLRLLAENGYKLDYETSKLLLKNHLPITNNKYSKMIGFITKN